MGNCIKTKLKGAVNNSNLELLNALPLYVKDSGNCTNFTVGDNVILVKPDGSEVSLASGNIASAFSAGATEQKYFLKNKKYNMPYISCGSATAGDIANTLVYIKTEDLAFMNAKIITSTWCPIKGNIGNVFKYGNPSNEVKHFMTRNDAFLVTGTIEDFAQFISKIPDIEELSFGQVTKDSVRISLDALAENTNCKAVALWGGGIVGDVYPFVQKARQTTENTTLSLSYFNIMSNVTVNGEEIPSSAKKIFNKFVWDANSISFQSSDNNQTWTTYKTWNI